MKKTRCTQTTNRRKYRSQIKICSRWRTLGIFDTLDDAQAASDHALKFYENALNTTDPSLSNQCFLWYSFGIIPKGAKL